MSTTQSVEVYVLSVERHRQLLASLSEEGATAVPELSERLQVSPATVRRDLKILAAKGLVQRVHGGAMLVSEAEETTEPLHQEKIRRFRHEKIAIAREAASRVRNGDVIALDSGSTTLALARELRRHTDLTVITTDLEIAMTLADSSGIDVIITGGSVRRQLYSLVGPLAEQSLRDLNAQICFLGADAIDTTSGVTNASLPEVVVKRALLNCGRQKILLADHSKFDRVSLAEVAPLDGFTEVITDAGVAGDVAGRYVASGARLTLAPLGDATE